MGGERQADDMPASTAYRLLLTAAAYRAVPSHDKPHSASDTNDNIAKDASNLPYKLKEDKGWRRTRTAWRSGEGRDGGASSPSRELL